MNTNKPRPPIPSAKKNELMSGEEKFQNETLRPIIKMKHDLLIAHLRNYILTKKYPFKELPEIKKLAYLESAFGQDLTLRSELRGIIIGQFTSTEYTSYLLIKNAINKRIMAIVKERMIDHLSILSA